MTMWKSEHELFNIFVMGLLHVLYDVQHITLKYVLPKGHLVSHLERLPVFIGDIRRLNDQSIDHTERQ